MKVLLTIVQFLASRRAYGRPASFGRQSLSNLSAWRPHTPTPFSRSMVAISAYTLVFLASNLNKVHGIGKASAFQLVEVVMGPAGSTDLSPLEALTTELSRRTSISPLLPPKKLYVSKQLFKSPLVFLRVRHCPQKPEEEKQELLKLWLGRGGTIILDFSIRGAQTSQGFECLKHLSSWLIGDVRVFRIPRRHVIFRSFYRLHKAAGRIMLDEDLYGVKIGDRYAIIACFNDMLGALEKHNEQWKKQVLPGGEKQREKTIRLLINIITYAVTKNYKDEETHVKFLKLRRKLKLDEGANQENEK